MRLKVKGRKGGRKEHGRLRDVWSERERCTSVDQSGVLVLIRLPLD